MGAVEIALRSVPGTTASRGWLTLAGSAIPCQGGPVLATLSKGMFLYEISFRGAENEKR
jgi:hypothetical protein